MTPDLAIANNQALYGSIFRAHQRVSRIEQHYWSTDAEPPPYYSRLVTRTRGSLARDAQLTRLAQLAALAAGQRWACKDSFDELPSAALVNLGLQPLFRAWWYGWGTGRATPPLETAFSVERVTSSAALIAWEAAWRESSPASPARIFPDALLVDANLELFAVTLEGREVGGFIVNRSDGAIGLSNVFQVSGSGIDAATFMRDCARYAARLHVERAVVGFGPLSEVENLARVGIVSLGPLAVWASP